MVAELIACDDLEVSSLPDESLGDGKTCGILTNVSWVQDLLNSLFGPDSQLTPEVLRSRRLANWLRCFVADLASRRTRCISSPMRTRSIVTLLAAKAEMNQSGVLSLQEFRACAEALGRPSLVSIEEEVVWSIFDTEGSGKLDAEQFADVRRVWAALGISSESAEALVESGTAAVGDSGSVTRDHYNAWCRTFVPLASGGSLKVRSLADGLITMPVSRESRPRSSLSVGCGLRPHDHLLRSQETGLLTLGRRPWASSESPSGDPPPDLSGPVRCLHPSAPRSRKLPGAAGRALHGTSAANSSACSSQHGSGWATATSLTAPRTPGAQSTPRSHRQYPAVDPDAQSESWAWRQARLRPYMKVKAEYKRPDGTTVQAMGELHTGWGVPMEDDASVPHSRPPPGVRRAGAPGPFDPPPEQWRVREEQWRDGRRYVVVLVNGVERLIPRECVTPIDT
eukprot:TRINITY_DN29314_c0_g1_i1.p1 TRINITY_DN29314_c0_g1~~TRINITY_DN29314_c0_g1_i1.p1  ORF type:complete len:453 (-),score=35.27 TRINITY_DN29314_c0_g1_i1:46-1404(-)